MTDLSPDKLLSDLKRFPLLTPAQYARVEGAARKGTHPPVQVVRRLVEKGWLTGYQGEVLLVGQAESLLFGPYILLDKLGEGGMGSVFKARHQRLGRIDALKVIRPDKISSKVVARRFLREIRLTSDLHHPHIVRAIDAGEVGRQWYLATEYIAGVDLGTIVRRHGPLPVPEACLAIYQASLALQHVHERRFVHRDLKPSNLIREDKTGVVKLLDLGLSRFRETAGEESLAGPLTTAGVILGTPDFMAPEQAVNPHGVDIRADLYSLGCTFYFLLTGSTPYTGSSPVDKLIAHTSSPIPRVQLPGGPAPRALDAIVSRLLAKKPEDRFQTPQEVTDALLTLRPGSSPEIVSPSADFGPTEPTDSPPPPVVDEWQSAFDVLVTQVSSRTPAPPTKHLPGRPAASGLWWLGAGAAVLVLSLVVFIIARAISQRPTPPSPETAGQTQPVATPPHEDNPADELRALRKALDTPGEDRTRIRERILAFRSKHVGTSLAAGAASLLRSLPSPLDPIIAEAGPDPGSPWVPVSGAGSPVVGLGFSPSDNQLLVIRHNGRVDGWSFPGRATFDRSKAGGQPTGFRSVSTDGRTMVAVRPNGRLLVWPDTSQAWREIDLGADLRVRMVGAAPDGKSAVVAFAEDEERLGRVDLHTGRVVDRLDHGSVGVIRIVVAPDATSCLVAGQHDILREIPMVANRVARAFEPGPRARGKKGGVYGPDGRQLYLTGVETVAGRFPPGATTADIRYEVPAPEQSFSLWGSRQEFHPPTCIAVSADEASIAVGTEAGILRVFAAGTGQPTHQFKLPGALRALTFSTHGRVIAAGLEDGKVFLVPLKD